MLDWIFGTSKSEQKPKDDTKPEDKLAEDELWVYDFVKQYLMSPIWRNPLLDFIEENCAVFEDTEENKFEYTKIHQEFTSLCAILVESIVEEIGISFKTLEKCIIRGMKRPKDQKIFQQILICDNFQTFKKIMISKNKELETEALRKMRDDSKKPDQVQDKIDEKELERLEMEKAIAMSLALEQKAHKKEEEQLEEAIRQSQIQAKQDKEKGTDKPAVKSLLGDLPPLMIGTKNIEVSPETFKEEKAKLDQEINDLKSKAKEPEASEDRKKRLDEQRELLRKKKQEERQKELKTFVENKEANSIPEHKVSQEEMVKRKKLMDRLKNQLNSD